MEMRPHVIFAQIGTTTDYNLGILIPELTTNSRKVKIVNGSGIQIDNSQSGPDIYYKVELEAGTPENDFWAESKVVSKVGHGDATKIIVTMHYKDSYDNKKELLAKTAFYVGVKEHPDFMEGPFIALIGPLSGSSEYRLQSITKMEEVLMDDLVLTSSSGATNATLEHKVNSSTSNPTDLQADENGNIIKPPLDDATIEVVTIKGGTRKPLRKAKSSTALSSTQPTP